MPALRRPKEDFSAAVSSAETRQESRGTLGGKGGSAGRWAALKRNLTLGRGGGSQPQLGGSRDGRNREKGDVEPVNVYAPSNAARGVDRGSRVAGCAILPF